LNLRLSGVEPWARWRACLAVAASGLLFVGGPALASDASAAAAARVEAPPIAPPREAGFGAERPSPEARLVADWVLRSGDGEARPFIVIDKRAARVYVFRPDGSLLGAAAALLGSAIGDHTVPGIGERKLSAILPEERTTPAGRFLAVLDLDIRGEEVLWVDYDSAVALHRLPRSAASERRPQRLASATPLDNRITFGCINVTAAFFDNVVAPAFRGTGGVVYVLPERAALHEVFGLEPQAP
jgi:hypothetical protein